jgi:hypothetical protein
MSEEKPDKPEADPFAQVVQFYDAWAKSWSDVMSQTVASKGFADSMGQQLEGSLDALTLARRQMGELMEQYLRQLNLPTRREVISMAERLTKIEMAVDDLDAKLDEVLDLLQAQE